MKVAQNDETKPTVPSVSVSGPSTEVNPQLLACSRQMNSAYTPVTKTNSNPKITKMVQIGLQATLHCILAVTCLQHRKRTTVPLRFICLTDVRNREYFPGCFPLSPVAPSTSLAHPSTAYCLVMFCDAMFALYLLFLPPLLSVRLRD